MHIVSPSSSPPCLQKSRHPEVVSGPQELVVGAPVGGTALGGLGDEPAPYGRLHPPKPRHRGPRWCLWYRPWLFWLSSRSCRRYCRHRTHHMPQDAGGADGQSVGGVDKMSMNHRSPGAVFVHIVSWTPSPPYLQKTAHREVGPGLQEPVFSSPGDGTALGGLGDEPAPLQRPHPPTSRPRSYSTINQRGGVRLAAGEDVHRHRPAIIG